MIIRHCFAAMLLVGIAVPRLVHAAQSYDNCNNFIDSLPATISTQGVWCLRHDLATNITGGNAITIATNNVTIDCNDFKIGGLAAGNASDANGIYATSRQNATIRHCNIRGFNFGIYLGGGAGHLVEDNRLDNNLVTGIFVSGSNGLIQRNRVFDTGGKTDAYSTAGINTSADVNDNFVFGLFADKPGGTLTGIYAVDALAVRNNRIGGFQAAAAQGGDVGGAIGILGYRNLIADNMVQGASVSGVGISGTFCMNNAAYGFPTSIDCDYENGNLPP